MYFVIPRVRFVLFYFQPYAQTSGLPLGRVRGRDAGASVPNRSVHRVASNVLRRHHIGIFRRTAGRIVHTVRDHRSTPDGQPRYRGAQHQSRGTQIPTAGSAHAGHSGGVVLHVLAAVPSAYTMDHTSTARLQHHGIDRRRELLSASVL